MKNLYLKLFELLSDNPDLVLATVTTTIGSTPQKPGSSAIFGHKGLIAGTIGGGVVEGRVEKLAGIASVSGNSGHFNFNLKNDISNKEEAICGGEIKILIDARPSHHLSVFRQINDSIANRLPGVLITMVNQFTDEIVLINRYWMNQESLPGLPTAFLNEIEPVAREMLKYLKFPDYREIDLSIPDEEPVSRFFLETILPAPQLIIAGAGHIGRVLAHLGDLLNFEVTIIDDRKEFANMDNIPEASHIIVNDIGEALHNLKKGENTYVVIVTRGHKDDAAALKSCLKSNLAYTGMIGSKSKIATMRSDFINNGWATAEQWDNIYTPIGVDIKSVTVEEIAVSIAAQLVLVRNSQKSKVKSNGNR